MGDPKGFLKVKRDALKYRPVCERVKDYEHVFTLRSRPDSEKQASRCMDCGTPFCHWGCPAGNYIPEWNDLVFRGQWREAFKLLDMSNNLPEITGRVCPAACEYACVLGINNDPVTIRDNELAVIEYAFDKGFIKAVPPKRRSGKNVAVVGSGPAGLSTAAQLNRAGHRVTVFEKDDKIGGILRYGIPDFKLEKWVLDRRIKIWRKEGIEFAAGVDVGGGYSPSKLLNNFDAVCLAGGSRVPRDLNIEGRGLKGIYFAMDYLIQSNKRVSGKAVSAEDLIDAKGKKIVVIGGGDTGADCVGTAHRQGAKCVEQIEVLPKPPECRTDDCPWPVYPMLLKTSTSHEEGGSRKWAVLTKKFIGQNDRVRKISCVEVKFSKEGLLRNIPKSSFPRKRESKNRDTRRQKFLDSPVKPENDSLEAFHNSPKESGEACPVMKEIPGSEFEIDADIVIIAVGFLHCEHGHMLCDLGVKLDKRGNLETGLDYMTAKKGVFAAGDIRRGQSLVVWAISEGRRAAYSIDTYLGGKSCLPNM